MANRTGQQLGNYHLIRTLAEGGFAEVYLGEHIHLGTSAAIKVLHTQLTSQDLEQFRTEARNIARLRHPHIVAVLDFDVQEDIPFLVMEYAPNGTLRQRHPKGPLLPPSTILPYLKQIAEALHYAHAEQLIHRDVKPENMLIGRHNEILLSDFGIAVAASSTTRDIVGTPAYMAPEQLQGKPIPASDQYALGIVAYEWLCGTPPFKGTFSEVAAQHLNVPPPSLCERAPNLSPALDKVIQKALAKDPQQRYTTVLEFVNALEAATQQPSQHLFKASASSNPSQTLYLQPTIPVTPPSTTSPLLSQEPSQLVDLPTKKYSNKQYNKYLTSRRTVLLALAGLTTAFIAGTSIAWVTGFSHPTKTAPTPTPTPIPEGATLHLYYGHFGYVYALAWSSDGTTIASASEDHSVHIWNVKTTADILYTYSNHGDGVHTVAWSPDGTAIASASADKTVQVWNASDESSIYTYSGHKGTVNAAAWSPDGTTIASGSADKTVQVWHATDGSSAYVYKTHKGPVNAVAWSPDGTLLASGSADKTVHIWKVADGSDVLTYSKHTDAVNAVAWSPDGTTIASGSADKTVHIWKVADGSDVLTYSTHTDAVNAVAWSPDGTTIASGSADNTVHIWNATDGSDILTYSKHTDAVNTVAWSPDGTLLASGSNDKTVLVWRA